MQANTVIETIRGFDTEALRAALMEGPPPPEGSHEDLVSDTINWVTSIRDHLIGIVNEIGEGDDVQLALAIQYVEFKSRWIAFNTKMNYTMFRGQAPVPEDQYRATAISELLTHIEPILNQSDVDKIVEFLNEPISQAA